MISEAVIARSDSDEAISKDDIKELLELFKQGKNFGSLIQIPEKIGDKLKAIAHLVESNINSSDIFTQKAANTLLPFVRQAMILGGQYDCVVANPPYMGSKGMNPILKDYASVNFPDSKSDLFAMFIERGFGWCGSAGFNSMVTMQSWMFLSSFEEMRKKLLANRTILTMAHLGARAFSEIYGEVVQTTAFVFQGGNITGYRPAFFRLVDGQEEQKEFALRTGQNRYDATVQDDFHKIPGNPVAYWSSPNTLKLFSDKKISDISETRLRMATADNNKFLRLWYEVDQFKLGLKVRDRQEAVESGKKWFSYQKGGEFRKWYGNLDYVVNWENDGLEIQNFADEETGRIRSHNYNLDFIFKTGVTWNALSSSNTSARISKNSLFDNAGSSLFACEDSKHPIILAFLNSLVIVDLIKIISPTLNYQPGDIGKLPASFDFLSSEKISRNAVAAIALAKRDWDDFETSWGFTNFSLVNKERPNTKLENSWMDWAQRAKSDFEAMKALEEENNRIFIEAYGLQDELTPDVPEDQITLARADREADVKRLISYAVACMMGRYRIDRPGLIYAHSGNVDFWEIYNGDPVGANLCVRPVFGQTHRSAPTFQPDDDGIIPVMDMDWFEDDAASRFEEFLGVAWSFETLEENMKFVADSLSTKAGETPRETIRRYFSTQFFKDHLQTYKKRPIYWLFSSGKQKAFECLVYLHRYNESTLSRMRNEYVTPLQGKFSARVEYLTNEINVVTSTSARTKLQKQLDVLKKKQVELAAFDDLLRHYADKRISLDLDDGVKVNYGKFGNLLAEVKAVTGGGED